MIQHYTDLNKLQSQKLMCSHAMLLFNLFIIKEFRIEYKVTILEFKT
jgi:hypothetical protein